MSEKPTTIRIPTELQTEVEEYMEKHDIDSKTKGIIKLVEEGLQRESEKESKGINVDDLLKREFELGNFIQMSAFLLMKKWESKENNGYTIIKENELERIEEFISAFSLLTHNSSLWRERLHDEGYTQFAEIIEEARKFM